METTGHSSEILQVQSQQPELGETVEVLTCLLLPPITHLGDEIGDWDCLHQTRHTHAPPILRTLPIYGVSTNEPSFFIWRYGCAETDVSPTLFNFNPGFGKSSSVPDLVARPCHSKMRSWLPTTVVSTGCRNETCLIKLGHEHDSSLGGCCCPK